MEIEPANIDQVKRARNGKMITIDKDVGGVVQEIKRINENLHVRYSDAGEYFVVYHRNPETGDESLVTTAQELDHRLAKRMEYLNSGQYDYLLELEKIQNRREKQKDERLKEQIGIIGEELAHALRTDLGIQKDSGRRRKSWGKGGVVGS